MSLADIRDGIKTRLDTIAGLYVHDTWPNTLTQFPAAVVMPSSLSAKTAMGTGRRVFTFEVVLIGGPVDRDGRRVQDVLDAFLDETGASSIIAALEADRTLGGEVTTLDVSWRNYADQLEIGTVTYLTVTFDVTVWP